MDNDKEKNSSVNLILFDQQAIQNDFPEWTYQAGMQVDLDSSVSEALEVKISLPVDQSQTMQGLASLTISFNSLGESAFQLQTELHDIGRFGTVAPVMKLGVSNEAHKAPDTWFVLQQNTIHALRQLPVEGERTSIVLYLQLPGLLLPLVYAATTSVDCSIGNIQFKEPVHPPPRYSGDFMVVGNGGQFPSMQEACEAVMALALPATVAVVKLRCNLSYQYTMEGDLNAQIPVGLIPLMQIEDTRSYASDLSQVILNWLKEQPKLHEAKGKLKFALTIYPVDQAITTPLLDIDSITLALASVHIE